MKSLYVAVCCVLGVAVGGAAARQSATPADAISKYDRGAVIEMLKQVKADLTDNYYDARFHGIDVEQTFHQAEERVRQAPTLAHAIGAIADVLTRLDDSHTVFIPPDRQARVRYGWRCSMVGDVPYVTAVTAGSDAEHKGVRIGDRVLAWNEYAPTRENLPRISYVYNFVRPQPRQHLVLRSTDGTIKTLDVETAMEKRGEYDLPDLVGVLFNLYSQAGDRDTTVGDIFVWRYSGFGDPKDVDRIMKKARTSGNLVLDLRGNSGGTIDALRTLISSLFDRDVAVSVERTRKGDKPFVAKGRKDAFRGRLVVLVDSQSGSSAEIAARVVQLEQRGTVIGDRTAGAVMAAQLIPHVYGGGRLTFYATMITVADVRLADGVSLEKTGVTPDETVLPSGADLAANRDPALARAVAVLGGSVTPEDAGRLFK
jgi:carboxyl-terminal processing protease